jgi:predicted metal-dependent HD superfamily phosphohydrolase
MSDLSELLQYVPVSDTAKTAVVNRMQEPHRRYHNLDHPIEMWRWHRQFTRHQSLSDHIVASFCLYHDAIYDPRGSTCERQSADLWLTDADTDTGIRFLVYECILASADHFKRHRNGIPYHEPALHWCLDLDLLRLAEPLETFIQRGHDIRVEYAHLSDQQWIRKSSEFRSSVMAQPKIYMSKELANAELQARQNLAWSLQHDWRQLGYLHGVYERSI